MAGRIPREVIQNILARVDLVDLIEARLPLKRSGSNFLARCPFHTEKSPSFNVSREKQFYHCFGCGAHGNAIDFLMAYDHLDFVEAVECLGVAAGIEIPRTPLAAAAGDAGLAERLYDIQEQAARFFEQQLRTPAGQDAIAYLKARGVNGELAQRYRLGYAPPDWQNFPPDLSPALLETAGLMIAREGRRYDRFRHRIMFPIRDRRGRVVGFGGRVLDDATPKYLNSPETPVFKKHREVYGLCELLKAGSRPARIVVVEGYMDVIALAQNGISQAVATLGTATSVDHIDLLFRQTHELVFCFDGDTAGRNAAWKALEAALPALRDGRSLKFLALPDRHDPDSLVREQGAPSFLEALAEAEPFSEYFFRELPYRLGLAALDTLEQRAALSEAARPLIEKLPGGVIRDGMTDALTAHCGKPAAQRLAAPVETRPAAPRSRGSKPQSLSIWRAFLSALIRHPAYIELIPGDTRDRLAADPVRGDFLRELLTFLEAEPLATIGAVQEQFRDTPYAAWIVKLMESGLTTPPGHETFDSLERLRTIEESSRSEFVTILGRLDGQMRTQRIEALIAKSAAEELSPEEREELRTLMMS